MSLLSLLKRLTALATLSLLGVVAPAAATVAPGTVNYLGRVAPYLGAPVSFACTSSLCFEATDGGLLQSADHVAWSRATNSLVAATSLAYVSCDAAGSSCVAIAQSGLTYATTDNGATWSKSSSLAPYLSSGYITTAQCLTNAVCVVSYGIKSVNYVARAVLSGGSLGPWTAHAVKFNPYALACSSATKCVSLGYVGFSGTLQRSSDGGLTWTAVTLPKVVATAVGSQGQLTCLVNGTCYFVTDVQPSALADTTTLIETSTDGGATWSKYGTSFSSSSVDSLNCLSATNCFFQSTITNMDGSSVSSIITTSDGGATWSQEATSFPDVTSLNGVVCPTATQCFAWTGDPLAGGAGSVYGSTDLSNWTLSTYPASVDTASALACPTAQLCYAIAGVNSADTVYVTTNGGGTWSPGATLPANAQVHQVACSSSLVCDAVGYSEVLSGSSLTVTPVLYHTTDGFTTIATVPVSLPSGAAQGFLSSVSCAKNACTAVGVAGSSAGATGGKVFVLSRGADGTWTATTTNISGELLGVSCASATSCVAVGAQAQGATGVKQLVVSTTDGSTWTQSSNFTAVGALDDIWCSSATTCAVAGVNGNYGAILGTITNLKGSLKTMKLGQLFGMGCAGTRCVIDATASQNATQGTFYSSVNGGSTYTALKLSNPSLLGATFASFSCPTTTSCLALSDGGSFALFH